MYAQLERETQALFVAESRWGGGKIWTCLLAGCARVKEVRPHRPVICFVVLGDMRGHVVRQAHVHDLHIGPVGRAVKPARTMLYAWAPGAALKLYISEVPHRMFKPKLQHSDCSVISRQRTACPSRRCNAKDSPLDTLTKGIPKGPAAALKQRQQSLCRGIIMKTSSCSKTLIRANGYRNVRRGRTQVFCRS